MNMVSYLGYLMILQRFFVIQLCMIVDINAHKCLQKTSFSNLL